MVALTWISKEADWWAPPKMHRLILLLIMMVLNLDREDDLIKDIAKDFSAVEKTGPPVGKKMANIINNALLNSVSREKLIQKLEKHSLKIKKYNPEIWSEMLQSKTRPKTLKMQENTKDTGLQIQNIKDAGEH